MQLDDLRFNDRDVRRILKLAVRREKDRYSEIDIDYDSAATYQDLTKVAEERGLNPDVLLKIIEEGKYKSRHNWREISAENIRQGVIGLTIGFLGGAVQKYVGFGPAIHPILYGVLFTTTMDVVDKLRDDKKTFAKLVQDDAGVFAGQTLGYTLGSLL